MLYEEELVAVMPPDPRTRRPDLRADGAARRGSADRLSPGLGAAPRVDEQLERADPAPEYAFETFELETIRSLASHGLGVAILPAGYVHAAGPEVASARLRPRARLPISLVWRSEAPHSPAASAFLEFARERFAPS